MRWACERWLVIRKPSFGRDLASLSGEGSLTVTVENEDLSQRYQGIVPLTGERLSDCLRNYFETSEQLPTRLWLHADENGVSGLLLQRLSDDSVKSRIAGSRAHEMNPAEIDDAWNRVQMLGDTLKPEELQTLSDRNILRRLFAGRRCAHVRVRAGFLQVPLLSRARRRHVESVGPRGGSLRAHRARPRRSPLRFLQSRLSVRLGRCRAAVRWRRHADD